MKKPVQFGKYFLLERVNVGGMAEVFKAKTVGVEGFERQLAVKRILPNIAEDKDFITMFIDEAKIAGQLSHANICQIFDLGKVDDAYFIALEYVSGKDLRALFDRAKQTREGGGVTMPIPQSCFVLMKVCEGLDYAHNKRDVSGHDLGLVHRDVSPQNVLISYEGEVKIIDFGIAKAAGKASKTQAGILKGKFGYMSPEQVRGLPLDRRSDIFAVGIVLYEMLTGERLFHGDSDFAVLEKVRNVEILPPSAYNKKIPEELERIVLKALAKDVEDRYQNAIDLHDDLQAFMYTSGEFYSRKELASYMKRTFSTELGVERSHDEEFASVSNMMSGGPSEAADSRPLSAAKKTIVPGSRLPPAASSSAPASGKGVAVEAGKTTKPLTAGKKPDGAHKPVEAGAGEAIVDDLGWDDDEVETHVYETAHDAGDAVLDEQNVDEGSLPPLGHAGISASAPVSASAARPEASKPSPGVHRVTMVPTAAPVVQKAGMASIEIAAAPSNEPGFKSSRRELKDAAAASVASSQPAAAAPATPSKTVNLTAPATVKSPRETITPGSVPPPSHAAQPVAVAASAPAPAPVSAPAPAAATLVSQSPPSQMEPRTQAQATVKVAAPLPAPVAASRAQTVKLDAPTGLADLGFSVVVPAATEAVPRVPARASSAPLYMGIGLAVLCVGGIGVYMATRPTTGEISLSISPTEGSRIILDGLPVTLAEASHIVRAPGSHSLGVEHDGYKPFAGQVEVQLGVRSDRAITLEPLARASFTLVSTPPGASASLDGSVLGATPFKAEGLAPGKHVLELKLAGQATWTQNIDLEPGKAVELNVALTPPVAAPVTAPPAAPAPSVAAPTVSVAAAVAAPVPAPAAAPPVVTPPPAVPAPVVAAPAPVVAPPPPPVVAPPPPAPVVVAAAPRAPAPRPAAPAQVAAVAATPTPPPHVAPAPKSSPPPRSPKPAPAAAPASSRAAPSVPDEPAPWEQIENTAPSKKRRLPAAPPVRNEPEPEPPPPPARAARVEAPAPARAARVEPPPPPPKPVAEGSLRIGSKPWTKISIDGKDTGLVTPQQQIKLPAGSHKVTLANPQFGISQSFSVEIRAGSTETIIKDLRPKEEEE